MLDASTATIGRRLLEDRARTSTRSRGARVPGDDRLLFMSELGAFERPAIWEPRPESAATCAVDLPGAVIPWGGGPTAPRSWLGTSSRGRSSCTGSIPTSGATTLVADAAGRDRRRGGAPGRSRVVPDERQRRTPRACSNADGDEVLAPGGERRPDGTPVPLVLVREPDRPARAGVRGDAARRRAAPDRDERARRARVARARRVRRGDPGVRRRGLRGGARELPRVDRLRRRVPPGA